MCLQIRLAANKMFSFDEAHSALSVQHNERTLLAKMTTPAQHCGRSRNCATKCVKEGVQSISKCTEKGILIYEGKH